MTSISNICTDKRCDLGQEREYTSFSDRTPEKMLSPEGSDQEQTERRHKESTLSKPFVIRGFFGIPSVAAAAAESNSKVLLQTMQITQIITEIEQRILQLFPQINLHSADAAKAVADSEAEVSRSGLSGAIGGMVGGMLGFGAGILAPRFVRNSRPMADQCGELLKATEVRPQSTEVFPAKGTTRTLPKKFANEDGTLNIQDLEQHFNKKGAKFASLRSTRLGRCVGKDKNSLGGRLIEDGDMDKLKEHLHSLDTEKREQVRVTLSCQANKFNRICPAEEGKKTQWSGISQSASSLCGGIGQVSSTLSTSSAQHNKGEIDKQATLASQNASFQQNIEKNNMDILQAQYQSQQKAAEAQGNIPSGA